MTGATPVATTDTRRALVWIDSRQAIILGPGRRSPIAVTVIRSDIPAHRRSMGHIRHRPAIRHGGGESQTAAEHQRLEHRERFLARVADRLSAMHSVDVLGPGDVPMHLGRRLRETDRQHGVLRALTVRHAPRLTTGQLIAGWKTLAGLRVRVAWRRRHGWRPGRMGKPKEAVRPRRGDSRPSSEADIGAILEA